MKKNLYVDFHIIQTVPPSCVNRDDVGSPKTATYGGTMRARVSSQAWKSAMRKDFKELFDDDFIGYRTKRVADLVVERIQKINQDIDVKIWKEKVSKFLKMAGVKAEGDKKDVLFFISSKQADAFARLVIEYENDEAKKSERDKKTKQLFENALNDNPSADILLFGRMAASNPSLNYDAASQVAHSISTHTVRNEYDYFTALDDYKSDEAGAGHLGTVEFNSSTLYRYATVNARELAENLESEELKTVIKGFAKAFISSMPTGKQNSFANRTFPDMVYVTLRDSQPINLAGAFEKPVKAGNDGYSEESKNKLAEYAEKIYKDYVESPKKAWIIGADFENLAPRVNLDELLQNLEVEIDRYVSEGE